MRLINRGTCNRKPDQWVLKYYNKKYSVPKIHLITIKPYVLRTYQKLFIYFDIYQFC